MAKKESDSSPSHPEFQMVLEKEAESLKMSRRRLADKNPYHNDDTLDINGDKTLFPMEPNRGLRGTISSQNYNHQELQCKPFNIEIPEIPDVITQEAVWKTAATTTVAAAIQQQTTALQEARVNNWKAKGWNNPSKPSNMYLVLPSYTEPQSEAIKKLIADEKTKLCSNSLFKHVFANIDFRIAFANSKNIKKLILSTKVL